MKHYKKPDNSIWAFSEDGSQDHLITTDMVPISDEEIVTLRNLLKTPDVILSEITYEITKRLDAFAKTRQYDSIVSACTYATSKVQQFQTEGQCCEDLRDQTWAVAFDILAEVSAGTRPAITSYSDVESLLPALVWPA